MLAHILERKYMFLICNLILAFLANTTSSSSDHFEYFQSQFSNDFVVDIEDEHEVQAMKKEEVFYEQLVSSEEEGSSEDEAAIQEEEEELGDINRDELNRRFEEFIRKMKEEIMIEPKTHPIAI
ncbi:uncharacterized protein LOC131645256 [Vicia villosa]|uniref:uncharacterized protein LOC131645256 n=1 Tax=Vicia villosa TaxID=3911 RepID=UPI00273CD76A|nr:uncharacterized protein LOC131645256 [Vicia villosa]